MVRVDARAESTANGAGPDLDPLSGRFASLDQFRGYTKALRGVGIRSFPLLGALLEAVSAGLRLLPTIKLPTLPRMADFAIWCEAVGRGQGWAAGSTMAAYRGIIGDAAQVALEASILTAPLQQLLEKSPRWTGTATQLLTSLTPLAGDKAKTKEWPSQPHVLSGQLGRLAPSLRRVGIWVHFTKAGRARTRIIELENNPLSEIDTSYLV